MRPLPCSQKVSYSGGMLVIMLWQDHQEAMV
jgi:hypothetical protein